MRMGVSDHPVGVNGCPARAPDTASPGHFASSQTGWHQMLSHNLLGCDGHDSRMMTPHPISSLCTPPALEFCILSDPRRRATSQRGMEEEEEEEKEEYDIPVSVSTVTMAMPPWWRVKAVC